MAQKIDGQRSFSKEILDGAELCRYILKATRSTPAAKLAILTTFRLPEELAVDQLRSLFVDPNYYIRSWDMSKEIPTQSSGLVQLVREMNRYKRPFSEVELAGVSFLAVVACGSSSELKQVPASSVHHLLYRSIRNLTGDRRYNAAKFALASLATHPTREPYWMVWGSYIRNCDEASRAKLWDSEILASDMHLKPPTDPKTATMIRNRMLPSELAAASGPWGIPAESLA